MNFHISLHTGETCYICENCGEKFYTPNGIKNHNCEKKRKRPEKDFRTYDQRHCRFCDLNFISLDEKKAHQCAYENSCDPKTVYCRFCGKLLNKLAYNRHIEIHSSKDWICNICDRKLATERALKVHITTHTGNKPYKCQHCSETFINKVVLDRHMRFHGGIARVFKCEFCPKELSSDTSLKSHIQRVHRTSAQCELCKEIFPTRDHMKDHLNAFHEPSICQYCNKSFALPRYLKMHEKLHNDDLTTKIQCQFCSKLLIMKYIKPHIYRTHPQHFDAWQTANPNL
jgi:KRAB domain-containing zinc finger protein